MLTTQQYSSSGAAPDYAAGGQSQVSSSGFLLINGDYIKKPSGGVLKIVEIVLCLVVIICNNVGDLIWQGLGGGWVNFVVIIAIFLAAFYYFVHLYDLPSKMVEAARFRLVEFAYHALWCLLWLIAGIVAAARASQHDLIPNGSNIAACSVFCFITFVVYAADAYFSYTVYRQGGHSADGTAPYNNFPDSQGQNLSAAPAYNFPSSSAPNAASGFPGTAPPYNEKSAY